eukprot:1252821-Rhodomonas_salina.4
MEVAKKPCFLCHDDTFLSFVPKNLTRVSFPRPSCPASSNPRWRPFAFTSEITPRVSPHLAPVYPTLPFKAPLVSLCAPCRPLDSCAFSFRRPAGPRSMRTRRVGRPQVERERNGGTGGHGDCDGERTERRVKVPRYESLIPGFSSCAGEGGAGFQVAARSLTSHARQNVCPPGRHGACCGSICPAALEQPQPSIRSEMPDPGLLRRRLSQDETHLYSVSAPPHRAPLFRECDEVLVRSCASSGPSSKALAKRCAARTQGTAKNEEAQGSCDSHSDS